MCDGVRKGKVQGGTSRALSTGGHLLGTQGPGPPSCHIGHFWLENGLCKVHGLCIIRILLASFLTVNAKTNIFPIKGLSKLKVYLFKFFILSLFYSSMVPERTKGVCEETELPVFCPGPRCCPFCWRHWQCCPRCHTVVSELLWHRLWQVHDWCLQHDRARSARF